MFLAARLIYFYFYCTLRDAISRHILYTISGSAARYAGDELHDFFLSAYTSAFTLLRMHIMMIIGHYLKKLFRLARFSANFYSLWLAAMNFA